MEIVILAAGLGTRMKSEKPKALQTLGGRPLLCHLLETVRRLNPLGIHLVVGEGAELLKEVLPDAGDLNWVMQDERRGTGHAAMQALSHCKAGSRLLILLADAPLISRETLECLTDLKADLGVLTVDMADPTGYGRITRSPDGLVTAIVEERDAGEYERKIREINTGALWATCEDFSGWLNQITDDNHQREYLLTDVVAVAVREGKMVKAYKTENSDEVMGVNDLSQLAGLERTLQRQHAQRLMASGVRIIDPDRFDQRGELLTGRDITIDINCIFKGRVVLGDGVSIGAGCVISDSEIGEGCEIRDHSVIDGAVMDEGCTIGPFARLRPGTRLARDVAIGNFVEVKKSSVGEGTKASHLSYLGDATIGSRVNIGAGTITCNYDGVSKHETHIGDEVFVGSNTALVAPVRIEGKSTIAAGSTITRDVPEDSLGIARGRQKNVKGWNGPRSG